ncbi:hypothetical protein ACFU7T_14365 [Streptomyces sp. NPDC057555]|uniref:hypothetical protein n=1 Tax=Streptomyces sp. NPDC057555 TaxID=3346166 RepID=UPI0036CC2F13
MLDSPFEPIQPHQSSPSKEENPEPNDSNGWLPWRRPGVHRPNEGTGLPASSDPQQPHEAAPQEPTLNVLDTDGTQTNVHGNVDVVAGRIEHLILETRKRDVLEGIEVDRGHVLEQPFVRDSQWAETWKQAIDPATGRLLQRVLIIVAPRSFGSTTFALRLLAEHTDSHTALIKLDADWNAPSKGRLPLEKRHAFQLDLKHPVNDQLSADFLDALSKHADNLRDCDSYLVLTVAQELWTDHRLSSRAGIHVARLHAAPDAQQVVEAHLQANGYAQLVTALKSYPKAQASLRGLTAVAAVRAARTIVMAWQEHTRLQQSPPPVQAEADDRGQVSLEDRISAALTDWREELDDRFGETTTLHSSDNPSLTVEDRCLLLALAVRQSAPMPEVARSADKLQQAIGHTQTQSGNGAALPLVPSAFASRGLRRRIHDVGAGVDAQDNVIFDRPAYGRAILEYVWDNYDVMRKPLLTWLVEASESTSLEDPAVGALADLTIRHGTIDYLNVLGSIACTNKPDVLSAVMESAVHNEHIGRLAWATLYRWAEQEGYASAVISLCQRILENASVSASTAKMAMVRLRRIAHTTDDTATRRTVLAAFEELAQRPIGTTRLVAEVRNWQQDKASARGGSLAFLALMTASDGDTPWLVSETAPDIDVERAVHDLLSTPDTAAEIIPRLTTWVRACTADAGAYTRLRDRLLPSLRGHNMFQAGMALMRELDGVSTAEGVNVADDFYHHLVDSRLQPVFPLKGDAA